MTTPTPDASLPEIITEGRRLEAAATKGPLIHIGNDRIVWTKLEDGCCGLPFAEGPRTDYLKNQRANMAFIAFARNHLPALLDAATDLATLKAQVTHQSKSILDLATERDALRVELSELARLLSMTEISETAGMWSASIKNIRGEFVLEVQSEMMEEPEVSKFTDIFKAIRAMQRQLT